MNGGFLTCDFCKADPIIGTYYECYMCADKHCICEFCYKPEHWSAHAFRQVDPKKQEAIVRQSILDSYQSRCSFMAVASSMPFGKVEPPSDVHIGVWCDGCKKTPIKGYRYKCAECPNIDLCGFCHAQNPDCGEGHSSDHVLLEIRKPLPEEVSCSQEMTTRIFFDVKKK